jgi:HPt (histidine-containing phosphotransfer) domain-containing protein
MAVKTGKYMPMSPQHAPPIDLAALKVRCMDDEKFAREMMAMFQAQFPPMLEQLAGAMKSPDLPRVKKCAHAIKGVAANIGAADVLSAADALEAACIAENAQRAAEAYQALQAKSDRCLAFIVTTLATAQHSL